MCRCLSVTLYNVQPSRAINHFDHNLFTTFIMHKHKKRHNVDPNKYIPSPLYIIYDTHEYYIKVTIRNGWLKREDQKDFCICFLDVGNLAFLCSACV